MSLVVRIQSTTPHRRTRERAACRMVVATCAMIALSVATVSCSIPTFNYYNPLDPQEDAELSAVLPAIADANLRGEIGTRAAAQSISTKNELRSLNIFNVVGMTSIAGIEFLAQLEELIFDTTDFSAIALEPLGKLSNLRTLALVNATFLDSNAAALPFMPALNRLELAFNPNLTDAASVAPLLSQYAPGSISLSLANTGVTPASLSALPFDRLSSLDINEIDATNGVPDFSFLPASNTTIVELRARGVTNPDNLSGLAGMEALRTLEITGFSAVNFLSMPPTGITSLIARDTNLNTLDGLDAPNLENLDLFGADQLVNISGATAATYDGLRFLSMSPSAASQLADNVENRATLASMTALEELYFSGHNLITDYSWLANLTSLRILEVNLTDLTDTPANLSALSQLVSLEEFRYQSPDQPGFFRDLTWVTGLENLRVLVVEGQGVGAIDDSDIAFLTDPTVLPNLTLLSMIGNDTTQPQRDAIRLVRPGLEILPDP